MRLWQEVVAAAPPLAPWLEIPSCHHHPVRVRWAGDRCSVCDSDIDFDSDQLVSCDKCNITVHQSCYGVPELPGVQGLMPSPKWTDTTCIHTDRHVYRFRRWILAF